MMTNRGVRKRYVVDLYKETTDKDGAKFPNEFEFISDETQKIVGMDEAAAKKVRAFETEIEAMRAPAKDFADSIFENLMGAKTLDYSLPEVLEPTTGVQKRVKTPDDEEELVYTPSEEELLDNEDDERFDDMVVTTTTVKAAQDNNRPQQGNRDNRGPRPQGQQNRGPNPNQGGRPNNTNRRPR
jgi:hypothetical protein